MKKLCYLLLCFLLACSASAADIVFQDNNFKQKLLQASAANNIAKDNSGNSIKIDLDDNGQITTAEALAVYQLDVSSASIANLDGIAHFTNLTLLDCSQNQLATLDVAGLTTLAALNCSNNLLVSLFLKNGMGETINLSGNPTLDYICADEAQIAALQAQVTGSCEVNSYCTLPPGGVYNTISGQIIFDAVTNPIYPFIKVRCVIGSQVFQTMTNAAGQYTFYTQETSGTYSVTPSLDNYSLFNTPAVANGTLNGTNHVHNFTLTGSILALLSADLEVAIAPVNAAMPGQNAIYRVAYKNKGPNATNIRVTVNFDETHTNYVSSTAAGAVITPGQIRLDATAMQPFETRSFEFTLAVDPTYPVGSTLNFTADIAVTNIIPGLLDVLLGDNSFNYRQTVEPVPANRTECLQGSNVNPSQIGEYLHYMITFENTGTDVIHNVVIINEYDTAKYDVNSIQVLYASHPVDVMMRNNTAKYSFMNADVGGPGGHGGILLKIKTNDGLAAGATADNQASVYFDYDQPLNTEDQTTFQALGMTENNKDLAISIYPNPSSSQLYIEGVHTITATELYDMSGRLLQVNFCNGLKTAIDISERANGAYLLKVISEKGVKVEKIIKK